MSVGPSAGPSWPLISTEDPEGSKAGEFSGVGGIIQPPPHEPERGEQLMIDYREFARGE